MRVAALVLVVLIGPAFAEEGWRQFDNARFGFSMEVPAGFIKSEPPANGDGATFNSPDGSAELRVWGAYLTDITLKQDAAQRRQWEADDGWKISYAPVKNTWFIYSGTKGDRIVYTKAVSACGGDVALYFRIEYPKSEKVQYDALVTRMSHSLKSGTGDQCP
jgi:hypothetical protein